MNKSDSISKLASALVKAQAEIKHSIKDASNPFFKSKYADLTSVIDSVKPALLKQGITVLQIVTGEGVETTLLHESGEYISGATPIITAKQNDPQALGSAITYSRRYGLQAMVGLGAVDDDAESAMGRTAPTANKFKSDKSNAPTGRNDFEF